MDGPLLNIPYVGRLSYCTTEDLDHLTGFLRVVWNDHKKPKQEGGLSFDSDGWLHRLRVGGSGISRHRRFPMPIGA